MILLSNTDLVIAASLVVLLALLSLRGGDRVGGRRERVGGE